MLIRIKREKIRAIKFTAFNLEEINDQFDVGVRIRHTSKDLLSILPTFFQQITTSEYIK
jgi:hypothetical protein